MENEFGLTEMTIDELTELGILVTRFRIAHIGPEDECGIAHSDAFVTDVLNERNVLIRMASNSVED